MRESANKTSSRDKSVQLIKGVIQRRNKGQRLEKDEERRKKTNKDEKRRKCAWTGRSVYPNAVRGDRARSVRGRQR